MLNAVPSLRNLQVIEAVARLNSITRASAELRLTQPAVTQGIAKLEARAGCRLFERQVTGTYPTAAGQMFIDRARRTVNAIGQALERIGSPHREPVIWRCIGGITLAQVRALVAIAETRSAAEAAAMVGVSEVSLGRAARLLERNVGVTLFYRGPAGLMTTRAGELLAHSLQLGFNDFEEGYEEIRQGHESGASRIRLGVMMLDPATLVGSVMVEFTRRHPDAGIKVIQAPFDTLRQRLRTGSLDFIVGVQKAPAPDLLDTPLYVDPYVIVARKGHPLCDRTEVGLEDLLAYDWIVPAEGAPRHIAFSRMFAPVGREPAAMIETHSLATIRATLAQSDRLTLLTRSELDAESPLGLFAALSRAPVDPAPVISITTRRDWAPPSRKRDFFDLLIEHGRMLGAAHGVVSDAVFPRSWGAVASPHQLGAA